MPPVSVVNTDKVPAQRDKLCCKLEHVPSHMYTNMYIHVLYMYTMMPTKQVIPVLIARFLRSATITLSRNCSASLPVISNYMYMYMGEA